MWTIHNGEKPMINLAKMPRQHFLNIVREAPSSVRMAAADTPELVDVSQHTMDGRDDADGFKLIMLVKNILALSNIPFECKR